MVPGEGEFEKFTHVQILQEACTLLGSGIQVLDTFSSVWMLRRCRDGLSSASVDG